MTDESIRWVEVFRLRFPVPEGMEGTDDTVEVINGNYQAQMVNTIDGELYEVIVYRMK